MLKVIYNKLLNFFPEFLLLTSLVLLFSRCSSPTTETEYQSDQTQPAVGDCIYIHLSSDPETLHPTNYRSTDAGNITALVFPSLYTINPNKPEEFIPYLAQNPIQISDDGKTLTIEIRPEATFQDGKKITPEDIEFSFKVIMLPLINCPHLRDYFDFLENITFKAQDSHRVHFRFKKPYIQAALAIATQSILPEHIFDPKGILKKYSYQEIQKLTPKQLENTDLVEFASQYNRILANSKELTAFGAGAYHVADWISGQRIVLERITNWWGDKISEEAIKSWPQKIIYQIRTSQTSAIQAIKSKELDIYHGIKARDFAEIKQDSAILKHYIYATPETFNMTYIGFNTRPPNNRKQIFTDIKVRKAFAHLIDVDKLIQHINMGFANRIVSTVDPKHTTYYNDTLKPIQFDIEKAKALIEEAGWKDLNQDGIVEKTIQGKNVPFEVEFLLNAGNEERKKIALVLQDNAKKIGIRINIVPVDFAVYQERLAKHDFDLMYSAISRSAIQIDLFQLWHTSQWKNGGTNFTGFGSPESDNLLEKLQESTNLNDRANLFKKIQASIYQEQPCIFLTSSVNRILIHKRFRNVKVHSIAPGYSPELFWTPKNLMRCAGS
ncbi:MAG: ABC transporter substrate-binding protein [Bacteroidia bacterium]|nr:ABC transporter substrate-binding protein [Bacteroidia bacterium]